MKKIANSLMPIAAFVLVGTCLVTVFDLVEVIDDVGRISGWGAFVLLPEFEHTHNFGGAANCRNDSMRCNFARASRQTRGRRRINRYQA